LIPVTRDSVAATKSDTELVVRLSDRLIVNDVDIAATGLISELTGGSVIITLKEWT
jgi:hypothetical protein